jgi:hypothetical protein
MYSQDFDDIVAKYSDLWTDTGRTIDVPEDIWIHIQLKKNADSESAKLLYKLYKISSNKRIIINTSLNKHHNQDKFEWTIKSTLYTFPVFIAWRTLYKNEIPILKDRAVIDIRKFNKIAILNIYPIPLQSDIIKIIFDCKYINVINKTDFFY